MDKKTLNILLIAAGAGVLIYLMTRPAAVPLVVNQATPLASNPLAVAGSPGILSSLMNSLTGGSSSTVTASVALPNPATVVQAPAAPATDNYILPGTVSAPIIMTPPAGDSQLPQDTADGFSTIYDL
jgi:hypothetical protein